VIRPIAICVIRRRDEILVFESRDTVKNETFYRPLGGGINFGEHSKDAVRREIFEEIGDLSLKGLSQAVAVYNVVAVSAQASAP